MGNNKKLEEIGIQIIRKLDYTEVENIANEVAVKIFNVFAKYNLISSEIYEILANTDMYLAKIPEGISKANYFYQDSSIYFSEDLKLEEPNEFVIHECIHRIQDYKNKKGKLKQLGICYFTETKIIGVAINEAAIQYITAKTLSKRRKYTSIYDMDIQTISPKYYPIITNIIEQLVFITGEQLLVESTLKNDNEFRYNLIDTLRRK